MSPAIGTRQGLSENLSFLILEVQNQLRRTAALVVRPSSESAAIIDARDDYIDNLKTIIQRKCYRLASRASDEDATPLDELSAVEVIAVNLERIADFCVNIVRQMSHLPDAGVLQGEELDLMLNEVARSVAKIEPAALEDDLHTALDICRTEYWLDARYVDAFRRLVALMGDGRDIESRVTTLFIHRYVERMGDALLNIGEAILSAGLGERIKIGQFTALEGSLAEIQGEARIQDVALQPMGETRSGCRIDLIRRADKDGSLVVLKEGRLEKVRAEKDSIERWQEIVPGLTPRIYSFQANQGRGSLLTEFLPGSTFETVLLQGAEADIEQALSTLCELQRDVWRRTHREGSRSPTFVAQIRARLDDVYSVHPSFAEAVARVGPLCIPSFDELLERVSRLDVTLPAPFTVLIHGDCNVDNLIWVAEENRIRFIDVYRSRWMDWTQDASVFIVSSLRLQVFSRPLRRRIRRVVSEYARQVDVWAQESGDLLYRPRLTLGLARSFATSARFVLDEAFARSLFLRARYLVDRLAQEVDDLSAFSLPLEDLFE